MGQAFREGTTFVFRSLLTLGLLESSKKSITKEEVLTKLQNIAGDRYQHKSQAKRSIDHIQNWLPQNGREIFTTTIRGNREKAYSINFKKLNEKVYIDFLDVLLTLNEIWIREADEAVKDLYDKEGERPLGIVTKLMLAIKENQKLLVTYDELSIRLRFKPKRLYKSDQKWFVDGIIKNSEEFQPPLEISKILQLDKLE